MAIKELNAAQYAGTTNRSSAASATATVGVQPFKMRDYEERCRLFAFLAASYNGGTAYKDAFDPRGDPVLVEHEAEMGRGLLAGGAPLGPLAGAAVPGSDAAKSQRYLRRKRIAAYENHVRPIIDKVAGYVVRDLPQRFDRAKEEWQRLDIDRWIACLISDGLKYTEAWIGLDSAPIDSGSSVTRAKAKEIDPKNEGKPYIVLVEPSRVVDFDQAEDGRITRVVFTETRASKVGFTSPLVEKVYYTEWTDTRWTRWVEETEVVGEGVTRKVLREDGGSEHSFGRCPYWRFQPKFPTVDICELARALFNICSLYDEELYANTFTQKWVTGATPEQMAGAQMSTGNMLVVADKDAEIGTFGAIPEQARALAARTDALRDAIYSIVSLENAFAKNVAESAEKRKRDLEGLYTMLIEIARQVEEIDNELAACAEVIDIEIPEQRTRYSRQFDVNSLSELLDQAKELRSTPFVPASFLRHMAAQIMAKQDPLGDTAAHTEAQEAMCNLSPETIEACARLAQEGAMTPELLCDLLDVPKARRGALILAMSVHKASTGGIDVTGNGSEPPDGSEDATDDGADEGDTTDDGSNPESK